MEQTQPQSATPTATGTGNNEKPNSPAMNSFTYKYKSILSKTNLTNEVSNDDMERILEKEKHTSSSKINETWNKINKQNKIELLTAYARKYTKEHRLNNEDYENLKSFFVNSLNKNKLLKNKDVLYNKDKNEITNIPALTMGSSSHKFTLKCCDVKHVSTLKSLTPVATVVQPQPQPPLLIVAEEDKEEEAKP